MISELQAEKAQIKSILNSAEKSMFYTLPDLEFTRNNICPTDQHLLQCSIVTAEALPVCRIACKLAGDFLKG